MAPTPSRANDRAPTVEDIEAIAVVAFQSIPDALRARVDRVVIQIHEFPDDETISDMELESQFDLLGLYTGVDLTSKSLTDPGEGIDMIFLYRRPLLDYWSENEVALGELVRHVLIHEIGHHFGFSDQDMEIIEQTPDRP
ncbi:MAG: metallopeptidase family protein [Alphaproteobacteria bacterium]|nr:metallopeptidase family protein [Alphaproteobacteria bacterium]